MVNTLAALGMPKSDALQLVASRGLRAVEGRMNVLGWRWVPKAKQWRLEEAE